jgi:hypothetical protein
MASSLPHDLGLAAKSGKPLIVTPFQIFCYRTRDSAARSHPHLRGIAVTALLGQMWRAMDEPSKDCYRELSMKLRESKPDANQTDPEIIPSKPEVADCPFKLPRFGVTPHRRFGILAAQASAQFLKAYEP